MFPISGSSIAIPKSFQLNDIEINKTSVVALVAISLMVGALVGAAATSASLVTITAFPIVVGALAGAVIGLTLTALALKVADLIKSNVATPARKTDEESKLEFSIKNQPPLDNFDDILDLLSTDNIDTVEITEKIFQECGSKAQPTDSVKYVKIEHNGETKFFCTKNNVELETKDFLLKYFPNRTAVLAGSLEEVDDSNFDIKSSVYSNYESLIAAIEDNPDDDIFEISSEPVKDECSVIESATSTEPICKIEGFKFMKAKIGNSLRFFVAKKGVNQVKLDLFTNLQEP